jgi:hypothetical protein
MTGVSIESMASLSHLQPARKASGFSRTELAQMFWRASLYVRRQRPHDRHTDELLAYLEREFRATWRAIGRSTP